MNTCEAQPLGPRAPMPGWPPLPEDTDVSNSETPGTGSQDGDHSDERPPTPPEGPGGPQGCEELARAETRRELLRTLRELKLWLPADGKAEGQAGTLAALQHAVRSVRRVRAHEEYYQTLVLGSDPDTSLCSLEDMEHVVSAQLEDNTDMFAAAVSLASGRTLLVSSRAASLLGRSRDALLEAKFTDFLAPQDVGLFHSCTTPYRLVPWRPCREDGPLTQECAKNKSFFCRLSVEERQDGGLRYLPFRMMPSLARLRGCPEDSQSELCCLLLAQRVHSGYEAPRIPPEKRIFTTTHTPNCLFQDVDERAVPLLGHLPQDLLETPLLLQLHPCDRPLMLALHGKVLQAGGQPFDYSPLRFRARNGEYVTLDTSWSGFINPWSRKVAFVLGRHRVRMGPLNKDVFAAPPCVEEPGPQPRVQELGEQIHRLLLQPVPHGGSSGYGSLGSNSSRDQRTSRVSSSDGHEDTGHPPARVCRSADRVHMKSRCSEDSRGDEQLAVERRRRSLGCVPWGLAGRINPAGERRSHTRPVAQTYAAPQGVTLPVHTLGLGPPMRSYQQMSSLESIIRYLQSCSRAATLKRKHEISTRTPTQGASDECEAPPGPRPSSTATDTGDPPEPSAPADVHAHLPTLEPPSKAESVVSVTSQWSYRSTIVHVGDKRPQPKTEPVEAASSGADCLEDPAGPGPLPSLSRDPEPLRPGLTEEALAAHTRQEERCFLRRFEHAGKLAAFPPHRLDVQGGARGPRTGRAPVRPRGSGPDSWKKNTKARKLKAKRLQTQHSSESTGSSAPTPPRPPPPGLGARSPLDASQFGCLAVPTTSVPAYPLPVLPVPSAPHATFSLSLLPGTKYALQPWTPMQATTWPGPPPTDAPGLPSASVPGQMASTGQLCARPQLERGLPQAPSPASPLWVPGPLGCSSPQHCPSGLSSPLQLSLLQLVDVPPGSTPGPSLQPPPQHRDEMAARMKPEALGWPAPHSDGQSLSSNLRILMTEDLDLAATASSSWVSASSESLGSGDNSGSGTGSDHTGHRSRHCGGRDSSENHLRAAGGLLLRGTEPDRQGLTTYQLPLRDAAEVLKTDRERLLHLHGSQPRFSQAQLLELQEVHPWVGAGSLPAAINITACVYCEGKKVGVHLSDEDIPSPGLSEAMDTTDEAGGVPQSHQSQERM